MSGIKIKILLKGTTYFLTSHVTSPSGFDLSHGLPPYQTTLTIVYIALYCPALCRFCTKLCDPSQQHTVCRAMQIHTCNDHTSGQRPYKQHGCLPVLVTKLSEPFAYVKASCLMAFNRKLQPPTRHSISSSFSRISPSFSCKQRSEYLYSLQAQARDKCTGHRQKAQVKGRGKKPRYRAEGGRGQRQKAEGKDEKVEAKTQKQKIEAAPRIRRHAHNNAVLYVHNGAARARFKAVWIRAVTLPTPTCNVLMCQLPST